MKAAVILSICLNTKWNNNNNNRKRSSWLAFDRSLRWKDAAPKKSLVLDLLGMVTATRQWGETCDTIILVKFLFCRILFSLLILETISYTPWHLRICYLASAILNSLHSCLCILIPGITDKHHHIQFWTVLWMESRDLFNLGNCSTKSAIYPE